MDDNVEVIKTEKRDQFFWIKLFSIITVVISWLVVIGFAMADKKILTSSVIAGGVTIIGIFAWLGQSVSKKFQNKKEEKSKLQPISLEKVKEILYKTIDERWDYIKIPESKGIEEVHTQTINENQIYTFKVNLLYGEPLYVIINATYPNIMPTVKPVKQVKSPTLNKLVNDKSQNPKDDPEVIEEIVNDELSGRTKTTRRSIPRIIKEEKKEDSLT